MSIKSCKLLAANTAYNDDANYRRTYSHDYLIETTSDSDLPSDIRSGWQSATPDPIPALWTSYNVWSKTDAGAFVTSRSLRRLSNREDDRHHWIATVNWEPPQQGYGSGGSNPNPLSRPVRYSLEWASHTKAVEKDIYDRPLENSAGQLFDPLEIDDARPVLVATKNMASLPTIIAMAVEYINTINDSTFFGAPAYSAKIESITSGELQTENEVDFYAVQFRIQFTNPDEYDGWDVRVLNRGPEALVWNAEKGKDELKRVVAMDKDGNPTDDGELITTAKLDKDGYQLKPGDEGIYIPFVDDVGTNGLPWRFYRPKDFSGLGIGGA
jgi:hypothetical protein